MKNAWESNPSRSFVNFESLATIFKLKQVHGPIDCPTCLNRDHQCLSEILKTEAMQTHKQKCESKKLGCKMKAVVTSKH